MSDKNEDYPETWPAWVVKIGKELEAAENASGVPEKAKGEPAWVSAMSFELAKLFVPTIQKKDYLERGPRFMGKMLGHQRKLLKGENGMLKQLERGVEAGERFDEVLRRKLNRKAYARWSKKAERWEAKYGSDTIRMRDRLDKVIRLKLRVVKHGLQLSISQPEAEHAEFHKGYFEALGKELYDDRGHPMHEKLSSTTMIYIFMVMYWRWVRQLPNIPALHRCLSLLLGASQVGDLTRVKGICRRFGVHLARCGRPCKKASRHHKKR